LDGEKNDISRDHSKNMNKEMQKIEQLLVRENLSRSAKKAWDMEDLGWQSFANNIEYYTVISPVGALRSS